MGGPERNHAFLKLAFKCNGKSSEFAFPIHFLQQGLALQAGQKGTFFFFFREESYIVSGFGFSFEAE